MAIAEGLKCYTYSAGADLSASQYRFVKQGANDTAVVVTGASDKVIGVLQNNPAAAGRACTVAREGISPVEAAGAIAVSDIVEMTANGRVQVFSAGTRMGICRGAAGAAGMLASIMLDPI